MTTRLEDLRARDPELVDAVLAELRRGPDAPVEAWAILRDEDESERTFEAYQREHPGSTGCWYSRRGRWLGHGGWRSGPKALATRREAERELARLRRADGSPYPGCSTARVVRVALVVLEELRAPPPAPPPIPERPGRLMFSGGPAHYDVACSACGGMWLGSIQGRRGWWRARTDGRAAPGTDLDNEGAGYRTREDAAWALWDHLM